ncbi:MAG: response regulator, partial [Myxococcota bacterium]
CLILESLGFETIDAAPSADEARQMLDDGLTPDLVISDIRMEGIIDGHGLAQWLRQKHPEIRILLTTGYTSVEVTNFPVLRKPYSLSQLKAELKNLECLPSE